MNTEQIIIDEINKMAKKAMRHWENNGHKWDKIHEQNLSEIHGALRILEVVSGKEYVLNSDGTISERG